MRLTSDGPIGPGSVVIWCSAPSVRTRTRTVSAIGSMCTSEARSCTACSRMTLTILTIGAFSSTTVCTHRVGRLRRLARFEARLEHAQRVAEIGRRRVQPVERLLEVAAHGELDAHQRAEQLDELRVEVLERAGRRPRPRCASPSRCVGSAPRRRASSSGSSATTSGSISVRLRSTTARPSCSASTSVSARSPSRSSSTRMLPSRLPDAVCFVSASLSWSSETRPRPTSSSPSGRLAAPRHLGVDSSSDGRRLGATGASGAGSRARLGRRLRLRRAL